MEIKFPVKVVCVDDSNYPDAIPTSSRPIEGDEYIATNMKYNPELDIWMYIIEELPLDLPYEGHKSDRFAIILGDDDNYSEKWETENSISL